MSFPKTQKKTFPEETLLTLKPARTTYPSILLFNVFRRPAALVMHSEK